MRRGGKKKKNRMEKVAMREARGIIREERRKRKNQLDR